MCFLTDQQISGVVAIAIWLKGKVLLKRLYFLPADWAVEDYIPAFFCAFVAACFFF